MDQMNFNVNMEELLDSLNRKDYGAIDRMIELFDRKKETDGYRGKEDGEILERNRKDDLDVHLNAILHKIEDEKDSFTMHRIHAATQILCSRAKGKLDEMLRREEKERLDEIIRKGTKEDKGGYDPNNDKN